MAGEFPLTTDSTYAIGCALGHDLKRNNPRARVVIGQDTRQSSHWIADRVTLCLASHGIEVQSAGVITTPGVAFPHSVRDVLRGIRESRGQAVVTLGLLLLIATPVLRVAVSIVAFAYERDRPYVVITTIVLLLLILSFALGTVERT